MVLRGIPRYVYETGTKVKNVGLDFSILLRTLTFLNHSSKGSKSNQGKIACAKRLIPIHYKRKPLVLFSTGNAKGDTIKSINHGPSQQ
ncbi:hypothetical protein [Lactococcus lactis]|uniref:hypothetical protein n=1 Tax=Lactococcus lactis TaxID=1358 RepID=UPI0024A80E93|nr:hypothetical protein [Lactococcus lactis]